MCFVKNDDCKVCRLHWFNLYLWSKICHSPVEVEVESSGSLKFERLKNKRDTEHWTQNNKKSFSKRERKCLALDKKCSQRHVMVSNNTQNQIQANQHSSHQLICLATDSFLWRPTLTQSLWISLWVNKASNPICC